LEKGKNLEELKLKELSKISSKFDSKVFEYISLENSVDRKNVYGGTARNQIKKQIRRWQKILKEEK
jgi:argininosuccinate lyase